MYPVYISRILFLIVFALVFFSLDTAPFLSLDAAGMFDFIYLIPVVVIFCLLILSNNIFVEATNISFAKTFNFIFMLSSLYFIVIEIDFFACCKLFFLSFLGILFFALIFVRLVDSFYRKTIPSVLLHGIIVDTLILISSFFVPAIFCTIKGLQFSIFCQHFMLNINFLYCNIMLQVLVIMFLCINNKVSQTFLTLTNSIYIFNFFVMNILSIIHYTHSTDVNLYRDFLLNNKFDLFLFAPFFILLAFVLFNKFCEKNILVKFELLRLFKSLYPNKSFFHTAIIGFFLVLTFAIAINFFKYEGFNNLRHRFFLLNHEMYFLFFTFITLILNLRKNEFFC
jgi:hypothetical protein